MAKRILLIPTKQQAAIFSNSPQAFKFSEFNTNFLNWGMGQLKPIILVE